MIDSIANTGLKASITDLLTNSGSRDVADYRISYYKLGRRDNTLDSELYDLETPWVESFYGDDTTVDLVERNNLGAGDASSLAPGSTSNLHAVLPQTNIAYAAGVAKIKFVIDKYPLRAAPLTEMGIFIKNPLGYSDEDKPVMAAYALFDNTPYDGVADPQNILIPVQWVLSFVESE